MDDRTTKERSRGPLVFLMLHHVPMTPPRTPIAEPPIAPSQMVVLVLHQVSTTAQRTAIAETPIATVQIAAFRFIFASAAAPILPRQQLSVKGRLPEFL